MRSLDEKFAGMSAGFRDYWLGWACGHDWAQDCRPYYEGEFLVTASQEYDRNGNWSVVKARHATPRALRDWAGY